MTVTTGHQADSLEIETGPGPGLGTDGRMPVTPLTVAAWASLGAGAIHAAAIGIHAEHRQAALVFTAVAIFQIVWGLVALAAPSRRTAAIGLAGSAAVIGGYLMAKTSGIDFVEGLEPAESMQIPDTIAAALAGVAAVVSLTALVPTRGARVFRPVRRITGAVALLSVLGLTVPALVNASVTTHDHGDNGSAAGTDDHTGHTDHPVTPADGETAAGATADDAHTDHAAEPAVVPPKAYDPTQPIDLGGVDGVTPEQQAAAENMVAITLIRLPKYADTAAAEADGFRSINDGATGYEHYINWSYIDDDHVLDPDYPESLVYRVDNGRKQLVSAMFMMGTGKTLDDVPELGGKLTQWHIHDNLCLLDRGDQKVVAGITTSGGACNPPLVKLDPIPMIHVWIVPHSCGPFAALEGVGAGQIAEGEERLCDHAHGA